MLDGYVARELPSEVWLVEILLWSNRKMNNKENKCGRFGYF
jgi:hypothetical protein